MTPACGTVILNTYLAGHPRRHKNETISTFLFFATEIKICITFSACGIKREIDEFSFSIIYWI